MHWFEFIDLPRLPVALRQTLHEVLELCNQTFRSFNCTAAEAVLRYVREHDCEKVVELGAGRAVLTSLLAPMLDSRPVKIVPCDLYPDTEIYRALQESYPDSVEPIYAPVDFSSVHDFGENVVAVMIASFHHIPPHARRRTIAAITQSTSHAMVFEPLRNTPWSMLLVLTSIFPAILLPLAYLRRPGRLRRFLLCWLLPIVPCIFVHDGLVSCLRQWTPDRWRRELQQLSPSDRQPKIDAKPHSLVVTW